MPRFVLLRHTVAESSARGNHWDLMLQRDQALATWAIERLPDAWGIALSLQPGDDLTPSCEPCEAIQLPPHRLAYLQYEGSMSGERGEVARCDGGEYVAVQWSASHIEIELHGNRLTGRATLTRTDPSADGWQLKTLPAADNDAAADLPG